MSGGDIDRVPCVDDLCTGTVNHEGRCNYCGAIGPRPGVAATGETSPASDVDGDDARAPQPVGASGAATENQDDAVASDDERVPCPDDLCTGTLDASGICRYCGLTRRAPSGSNGVHGA